MPYSNKVNGLSSTQNAVLLSNVSNHSFHMNPYIDNSSCLLQFPWRMQGWQNKTVPLILVCQSTSAKMTSPGVK